MSDDSHHFSCHSVAPSALQPRNATGDLTFNSTGTANVTGRRGNQGVEGFAVTPDGKKLVSLLQSAPVQDSPGSQVKQVIARATSDLHMKMLQRVGADRVVFPSKMQGHRLGMELVRPNLLERLRLDDRNSIEEIRVPQAFIGQSLREINLRKNFNVSVLAAGPDNQLTVNPPASHVLEAGELLVVMGASEALAKLPGS